jgi:3-deoxy-7-phosphoheptulonate synthase
MAWAEDDPVLTRKVCLTGIETRVVDVKGVPIGGNELVVMAGPCAIESQEQILKVAEAVAHQGARFLRGGAFKIRTSPRSFDGLGLRGLQLLREAADAFGLLTVSEVLTCEQVEQAAGLVDLLQIGTRNMQNTPLLRAVGRSGRPVLLKRGFGSTIDEWLNAAEYILQEGNESVVLCERGIRTFETSTRFTLDVAAVPVAQTRSGLPVLVDPSHAAGDRKWVPALALAGIGAGARGLLIEVHDDPDAALSDGRQSLDVSEFAHLMSAIRAVAQAMGLAAPREASTAAVPPR